MSGEAMGVEASDCEVEGEGDRGDRGCDDGVDEDVEVEEEEEEVNRLILTPRFLMLANATRRWQRSD
jgi:hypothetical protein